MPNSLGLWFDQRAESHEFSGVALVWRDGAPVFSYAGGIAHRGHGVPITNETRFGVASVTKMVTARRRFGSSIGGSSGSTSR